MTTNSAKNQGRNIPVTDLDEPSGAQSAEAAADATTPHEADTSLPTEESPPHLVEMALSDEELKELCMNRICPSCEDKTVADDAKLRMLAEMDNYKKRLEREKTDLVKYANEKVIADIIPALDTLDLALLHGSNNDACKDLIMGVEMTRKMFLDILAQHGLTPVGEVGEEFTPEKHEAISEEARQDMDPGQVCQLVSRGYTLKDRLVRPAKVIVSGACS